MIGIPRTEGRRTGDTTWEEGDGAGVGSDRVEVGGDGATAVRAGGGGGYERRGEGYERRGRRLTRWLGSCCARVTDQWMADSPLSN